MWIVGIGIVLIFISVGLYLVRKSQQGKLRQMTAVETSSVQDLRQLAQAVRQDLEKVGQTGSGLRQIAEVKGTVRIDDPLTSEIAKQPCVYYSANVTREYEESYWETNSQTNQREQRTRRSSETVSNNSRRVPFWVEDATGRIKVNPEGADIDAISVVDRFEPAQGGVVSFGGFRLDVSAFAIGGSGTRTLGYRFRESLIPPDRPVYVLAEALDDGIELVVQKPHQSGKRFIISLKSEEELVRSTGSAVRWLLYGAIASGAVGVALVIVGLVR